MFPDFYEIAMLLLLFLLYIFAHFSLYDHWIFHLNIKIKHHKHYINDFCVKFMFNTSRNELELLWFVLVFPVKES